jgi:fatty-acyl-CoA synthase
VYPAEVECAILELPDVAEAAVIGVPDDKWGEVGLALVVATTEETGGRAHVDPDAIIAALRDRLAGFKVPRYVEVVDELPKTATGKVRKPVLRDRYSANSDGGLSRCATIRAPMTLPRLITDSSHP